MFHTLPDTSSPVKQAVILCHGYGSNGRDMAGLADTLAKDLPQTAWITPDAPRMVYPGGYEWFGMDTTDLTGATHTELTTLTERARQTVPVLSDLIKQVQETYHLPFNRIVLGGFSQGGLMALLTALSLPQPPAGVLCLSGVPYCPASVPVSVHPFPILMTHGTADPVVPPDQMIIGINQLRQIGLNPQLFKVAEMEHCLDATCCREIILFLRKLFY